MEITYRSDLAGVGPDHLVGFFEGWPDPPSPHTHLRILTGSAHVVLAWRDGRVIGFVTAVSDGVLSAYIPLLEVLPDERGRGVGAELLRRVLEALDDIYMVDLVCDPERAPFYERCGMQGAQAMIRRNYSRQSGD